MHQQSQAVVRVVGKSRLSTPNLNLIESAEAKIETAQAVLKQDRRRGLAIRRILDELVQVEDGLYLGKARLKWWWGAWQLVAYFSVHAS